jgi:hypothetical protein
VNRFFSPFLLILCLTVGACDGQKAAPVSVVPTPAPTTSSTFAPGFSLNPPGPVFVPVTPQVSVITPVAGEREVSPSVTNSAIDINLSAHVVIRGDSAVGLKQRLFVMLSGTGGIPRNQRMILRSGSTRGYHAISLSYPNDQVITALCANSPVDDCIGLVRREIVTGEDASPLVRINVPNSIQGRLFALLTYLSVTYPNEDWNLFLAAGRPDWTKITIAGHSQGAGHAAYMAKLYSLDRTVMFSSPVDPGTATGSRTPWLSLPNVTSVSRQFGFTHTADELAPYSAVTSNWAIIGLGLFGAPVSVDTGSYEGSRQLLTSVAPNPNNLENSPAHSATVVDFSTPLTSQGEPLYRPVWIYLAFP